MDYRKARKRHDFGRPKCCEVCGQKLKPALHTIIKKESLFIDVRQAGLYKDKCDRCGHRFSYWA